MFSFNAMSETTDVFEIGEKTYYLNKRPVKELESIANELKQKKNYGFFLIMCTNGSYDKLIDLMSFLKNNGVNNVTLQAPQPGNKC